VTSRKKEAKETKEVKEDHQSWKKKANPNSPHKRLYWLGLKLREGVIYSTITWLANS